MIVIISGYYYDAVLSIERKEVPAFYFNLLSIVFFGPITILALAVGVSSLLIYCRARPGYIRLEAP